MLRAIRGAFAKYEHSLREPSFWIIANYEFGRWGNSLPQPFKGITSAIYGVAITLSEFLLHTAVHRETEIGEEFHLIHASGIRISPHAIIGKRVGITHDVVIGTSPDRKGAPVIGDDVFIGAGAKILGPVKVGNRARIAANSLVISDVPAGTTAIGVPAKVLRYTGRPTTSNEASTTEGAGWRE